MIKHYIISDNLKNKTIKSLVINLIRYVLQYIKKHMAVLKKKYNLVMPSILLNVCKAAVDEPGSFLKLIMIQSRLLMITLCLQH